MHDIADLTTSLVERVQALCPGIRVAAGSARRDGGGSSSGPPEDRILVRLVGIEPVKGPRSPGSVSSRLRLQYRFDLEISDAKEEHQALADLAFAFVAGDDPQNADAVVSGTDGSVLASFEVERRRELAPAKPVRETIFKLSPTARISGVVQAEGGMPLARARLQVSDGEPLIITRNDGSFAFTAPAGTDVRAKVTAKGKSADVELRPGEANIITLAMEP